MKAIFCGCRQKYNDKESEENFKQNELWNTETSQPMIDNQSYSESLIIRTEDIDES